MSNQQSTILYGCQPIHDIATWYGCQPSGVEPKYPWVPEAPINPWTKENDEEHNKEVANILKEIQELIEKLNKQLSRNSKKSRNKKE